MSDEDEKLISEIIAAGIIGTVLGKLITGKDHGGVFGALAGAAIVASYNAGERAKQNNMTRLIKDGNAIYELKPDGTRKKIKDIPASTQKFPARFILK